MHYMGLVSQIERVFGAASHRKVWDHFTKAQRKNIDLWKKQSLVCTKKKRQDLLSFYFQFSSIHFIRLFLVGINFNHHFHTIT